MTAEPRMSQSTLNRRQMLLGALAATAAAAVPGPQSPDVDVARGLVWLDEPLKDDYDAWLERQAEIWHQEALASHERNVKMLALLQQKGRIKL